MVLGHRMLDPHVTLTQHLPHAPEQSSGRVLSPLPWPAYNPRRQMLQARLETVSSPIYDVDSSGCLAYHLAWCTRCWHAWALPQRYASYLRSEECYGRYSDRPGPGDP